MGGVVQRDRVLEAVHVLRTTALSVPGESDCEVENDQNDGGAQGEVNSDHVFILLTHSNIG